MGRNQVYLGAVKIMDISDSTITPETVLKGAGGYGADGEWIDGAVEGDSVLAKALAAAQPGDTVTLTEDVTDDIVVIPSGVTLDLGGYDLTANAVIGLKGSFLTATPNSSAGVGGRILVEKEAITLSEQGYINASGQYILPVWDPNQGCFVFSLFVANTDESKGRGLFIDEDNEKIKFKFKHQATGYVNKNLLVDGSSDNGLSVFVRLENDYANGDSRLIDFVFGDEIVGSVTGAVDYSLTLNGYSETIDDISAIKATAMIVSDTGATCFGETWTYDMAMPLVSD